MCFECILHAQQANVVGLSGFNSNFGYIMILESVFWIIAKLVLDVLVCRQVEGLTCRVCTFPVSAPSLIVLERLRWQ